MRDIRSRATLVPCINPAVYNTSQTGAGVDISGYDAAMAIVQVGAITDGTHTPKLQESADNVTFTDVAATDIVTGSAGNALAAATASSAQWVGYVGALRYIRVYVTSSGVTGAAYCASISLGKPIIAPTA
jgi:hypothetical protein